MTKKYPWTENANPGWKECLTGFVHTPKEERREWAYNFPPGKILEIRDPASLETMAHVFALHRILPRHLMTLPVLTARDMQRWTVAHEVFLAGDMPADIMLDLLAKEKDPWGESFIVVFAEKGFVAPGADLSWIAPEMLKIRSNSEHKKTVLRIMVEQLLRLKEEDRFKTLSRLPEGTLRAFFRAVRNPEIKQAAMDVLIFVHDYERRLAGEIDLSDTSSDNGADILYGAGRE